MKARGHVTGEAGRLREARPGPAPRQAGPHAGRVGMARDIPAHEISDEAMQKIRQRRELVRTLIPEAIPVIKDFADEGLITGWRNITGVYPLDQVPANPKTVQATPLPGDFFCAKRKEK